MSENKVCSTLTQADLVAIAQAVNEGRKCSQFTQEEVSFIRDLITLLKETRSNVLKGIVSLLVAACLGALFLGIKMSIK